MYWRLLTSDPTAARHIVMSDKPAISTETDKMDKGILDQVCFPIICGAKLNFPIASAAYRDTREYIP